ncbi:RidA family protein [Frankia sp. CcI49]|uniref:RidA family protein n=1 Tax=Frankia sp. CcI49 TaxID=1745382 RepID=UPI000A009BF1|nr:RidA family protein [Frankia sp. CcI49]
MSVDSATAEQTPPAAVPAHRPVDAVTVGLPSLGLYSHAVRAPRDHQLVCVSGQLSVTPDGVSVGVGDFDTQMRTVLGNLRSVLASAGAAPTDLLKMTTYLVSADLIDDFYRVRETVFADWFPDGVFPGNTLLVVSRLVRPEFLIEIEALAVAPDSPGPATTGPAAPAQASTDA